MIFNCWFESYLFGSMVKNDTRDFSDFYRSVEFEEDRWTHYSVPEILENLWSRADCIQKPQSANSLQGLLYVPYKNRIRTTPCNAL